MKVSNLLLLMVCAVALFALTGCLGGGGGSSSTGSGGSGSGNGSTYAGSFSSSGGSATGGSAVHNPEPATLALFGSGLIAYALSRRKKKK